VEAALWLSSLFGRTVLWRGQRYRLLEGGKFERVQEGKRDDVDQERPRMKAAVENDPFHRTRTLETAVGTLLLRPIRPGDEPELLALFRDRLSPRSLYLFCP